MYWHGERGNFPIGMDLGKWYDHISKANLPLNHRFFAIVDLESGDLNVYMVEDMKNGDIYTWYDMAWFCTKSDINLGVVDRNLCPEETQNGRRNVH